MKSGTITDVFVGGGGGGGSHCEVCRNVRSKCACNPGGAGGSHCSHCHNVRIKCTCAPSTLARAAIAQLATATYGMPAYWRELLEDFTSDSETLRDRAHMRAVDLLAGTTAAPEGDERPKGWKERVSFRPGGYCDTADVIKAMQAELDDWGRMALASERACDALRSIRDLAYFDAEGGPYFAKAENALAAIEGRDAHPKTARPVASQYRVDAARWRAFVGSARIQPQGSAGLNDPMPNHYAHMGLEIWTTYDRDYSPELLEQMDSATALGRKWLTQYADIAVAALAVARAGGDV